MTTVTTVIVNVAVAVMCTIVVVLVTVALHCKRNKCDRINQVVSHFLRLIREHDEHKREGLGLQILLQSGALTLRSSGEIREACRRIQKYGEGNPIIGLPSLKKYDPLVFFRFVDRKGYKFDSVGDAVTAFADFEGCFHGKRYKPMK